MNIAILGTGQVGQSLGSHLSAQGHAVMLGTRDATATLANPGSPQMGTLPFADWQAANPAVRLATFGEAATFGELIILATSGMVALAVLQAAGRENLAGKILLDTTNPLDYSKGIPPTLSIVNDDSLGETIQRQFPAAKVVKTLNTVPAALMVNPAAIPGEHNVFISGNQASAKATVCTLLTDQLGWPPASIIDLGDITTARGTEQLLPIGIRLWSVLQTPMFNFAIVRQPVAA